MENVGYCDNCRKEVGASNLVNHPYRNALMYCKRCLMMENKSGKKLVMTSTGYKKV